MKMKTLSLAAAGAFVLMSLTSGCASSGSASDQTAAPDAAAAPAPTDASTPAAGGMPAAAETAPAPAAAPAPMPAPAAAAAAPSAPTTLSDAEVVKRVKAALASHAPTRGLKIGIGSVGGVVRLTGTVATSVQIDQIKSVVTDVEGVKEVNNLLKSTHP